jgi:hypothetical protein
LASGATQAVPAALYQGYEYRIIGACDQACGDLDLRAFDQNGQKVAADVNPDARSALVIAPVWSGPFQIQVVMASCAAQHCTLATQLYGRPLP